MVNDLAVVYRTMIGKDTHGKGTHYTISSVVTNQQMKNAGIDIDELDEAAMLNTMKHKFRVINMEDLRKEMGLGFPEIEGLAMTSIPCMYILTNEEIENGACVLLFDEVLFSLAERIEDDLFILPSSIHEVIAVPTLTADTKMLKQMVRDMNDAVVDAEEILSYEVYRYDRNTRTLMIAE